MPTSIDVRGLRLAASVLIVTCALALPLAAAAQDARPPSIRFTTDEAFDASRIPAYAGKHDDVYKHIDASIDAHIAQLQRWVRQPSVSAQKRGIAEMANLVAADLRALGFRRSPSYQPAGTLASLAFTTPAPLEPWSST
jgi:hypothetical protein